MPALVKTMGKKSVELNAEAARPSRIRRDPSAIVDKRQSLATRVSSGSREWEITIAIVGIVAFALAINIIWLAVVAWAH